MEDKNVPQVKDISEDESISEGKDKSENDDNKRLVSFMLEYDEAIAEFLDNYHDDQDMLVTVDAATEKATRCNKALIETLGYGKEEIVGQSIFNLYHRDCAKDAKELFRVPFPLFQRGGTLCLFGTFCPICSKPFA